MPWVPLSDDPYCGPAMRLSRRTVEILIAVGISFFLIRGIYWGVGLLPPRIASWMYMPLREILNSAVIGITFSWLIAKRTCERTQRILEGVPGAEDTIRETLFPITWLRTYFVLFATSVGLGLIPTIMSLSGYPLPVTPFVIALLLNPFLTLAYGWLLILLLLTVRRDRRRIGVVVVVITAVVVTRVLSGLVWMLSMQFVPTFFLAGNAIVVPFQMLAPGIPPAFVLYLLISRRRRHGATLQEALWGIRRSREGVPQRVDLTAP
ncbi:hypothetical protein GC173_17135 [bacterium]|nr:hypothetical protein [bacterium]